MSAPRLRFEFVPEDVKRTFLGKRVVCATSPIGRVCAVIHMHEDGEQAFMIINLGSSARVGEDRRAVPMAMLAENDAGDLVLTSDVDTIRRSPIYVEGARCNCQQWLERVTHYYAHA